MSKIIDLSQNVSALCEEYPELIDILVDFGFKPLANPLMRKTIASHMTIPSAAGMKDIPLEKILFALAEHGFSIVGSDASENTSSATSDSASANEPGHVFLARMGKTRLRPGGKAATDWLLENGNFGPNTKVLEVACNMGTTLIEVAEKYGCHVTGVDLDPNALKHAKENIRQHGLEDKITLTEGNAFHLPFPDHTFDVIINEAMLTMLVGDKKDAALSEYSRVLKPGGKLLTQDVCLRTDDSEKQNFLIQNISRAINVHVEPLTIAKWTEKIANHGFKPAVQSGSMTLLDPEGMIRDEGEEGAEKILLNAMKPENVDRFQAMYKFFQTNEESLGYIAIVSTKE